MNQVRRQAVDNWNAANPDIQVEYVRFVNDESRQYEA